MHVGMYALIPWHYRDCIYTLNAYRAGEALVISVHKWAYL